MPQQHPIQTNFTGGELSPRLYGRVDTAKYQNGCKTLENFLVMPHGGAKKRPGTKYINNVKNNADNVRLIPFQYAADQAYILEFGPSYIRFFTNGGILTETAKNISGITKASTAVVTTSTNHGFSTGDRVIISGVGGMYEVNGVEYTVTNLTSTTFQLSGINSTGFTTYTSGGTVARIYEVATAYTASQVNDLNVTQSADVLYIAHRSHPLRQLVRSAATTWTLSDVSILRGPWRGLNKDETITIQASDTTGTVTLTASSALFNSNMVGAKIKLYIKDRGNGDTEWGTTDTPSVDDVWSYEGNSYRVTAALNSNASNRFSPPTHLSGNVRHYLSGQTGNYVNLQFLHKGFAIVTLTGYTSSTVMTGTVYSGYGYNEIPGQIANNASGRYRGPTSFWEKDAWSADNGYPGILTLFEQRLMTASSISSPQTIWGSVSGNFRDFEEGTDDASALNYTLGSEQVDVIRWMNPGKVLIIGTTSGEYVMSSSSLNEALTPKNVRISRETSFGSSPCAPVRVGNAVLFVQRRGDPDNPGRKLREMAYSLNVDGFESNDLTIWSEHITGNGITQLAYQADPDALVWATRTDGRLACLTYEKPQEVVAWHKHYLGGYSDSGRTTPAVVEEVATIPGTGGDELWMCVRRYINGQTVRYIEVMSMWDDTMAKEDAVFSDCAITYSGSSTSTITGLRHLIGETVAVLGDGSVIASQTVSSTGTITLPSAVTKAQIGLPYTATLETLDIEAGAAQGTAQGRQKRIANFKVRIYRSLGGKGGPSVDKLDDILYRTPADPMGTSPALFSGDRKIAMPSGWDGNASVYIQHSQPLPMQIISIMPEVNTTG